MLNIQIFNSVSDCDTFLADAGQMKSSLEIRIMGLNRRLSKMLERASQLPNEIERETNRLTGLSTVFATAQEGKRKDEMAIDINTIENQLRALASSMESNGPVAYLELSRDLAYATAQLTKINEAIAAVETRKSELNNAAAA